jgi:hypothetical protein
VYNIFKGVVECGIAMTCHGSVRCVSTLGCGSSVAYELRHSCSVTREAEVDCIYTRMALVTREWYSASYGAAI